VTDVAHRRHSLPSSFPVNCTLTGQVACINEERNSFSVLVWQDVHELGVGQSLKIDAIMRNSKDARGSVQNLPAGRLPCVVHGKIVVRARRHACRHG
jgi:hypothetical protein